MAPKPQPTGATAPNTDSPAPPSTAAASPAPASTPAATREGSEAPISNHHQSRTQSPTSTPVPPSTTADANSAAPSKAASTSQPMAKSSSSSSGSVQADAKDGTATGPSPYGTRSRNRNGRARPNYAEDKDLDVMDFEMYPERKDDADPKKATRIAPSALNDVAPLRPAASSTRKPLPSTDGSKPAATIKDANQQNRISSTVASSSSSSSIPAASAPPAQQASKKRKAGTSSTSSQQVQNGTSSQKNAPTSSALKRPLNGTTATGWPTTNMMSFENCKARPNEDNQLIADDGTVLGPNDHVYLVCEPPGEPYYIGRIMEFLHKNNDESGPVDSIRVNWFYRPKDIARKTQDTRQLFATMHSDISPLNTLRGKCTVKHKAEIPKMDDYRKHPDCFWWEKMYDRYIQKNYDAIPTSQIINVPARVKKVLDERWKFVLVEQGRGKELTSESKSCKRCTNYCASADSVDCGFCGNTYHMTCVRPPLAKKPARGFGWACGPCNVAQERRLEALNAPHLQHEAGSHAGTEDEEFQEEEEDDAAHIDTNRTSPSEEDAHPPPTAEQIKQASLWPYRYLGMHCKIEDALDYDDRIFPRASSRLGPRHQATVAPWPGRPVEYVKPLEIKKSGRKDGRHSKEVQALIEKDKKERESRPKHIQDEPYPGYIPRGEDYPEDDPRCTSVCLWKPAEDENGEMLKDADGDLIISPAGVHDYMNTARSMWQTLQVPEHSTNLEDVARDLLYKNNYNAEKALKELAATPKEAFNEPVLSPADQKKFEEAVSKYGSELLLVKRHLKTSNYGLIVRYWYKWKKTPQGKKIWGNYSQRKGKKEIKKAQAEASKAADEVADAHDDSAFDTEKAKVKKKAFMCKFCNTKHSRQWRRAPNVTSATVTDTSSKSKDKGAQYVVALCRRCAELWRRYAIQWEDMDEIAKKIALTGGRAWKRKIDEEVLKELTAANEMMEMTDFNTPEPPMSKPTAGPPNASTVPVVSQSAGQEPPRKKLKSERDSASVPPDASNTALPPGKNKGKEKVQEKDKEKEKEKPVEKAAPAVPPPPPPMPKPRTMPCDVCGQLEPMGDQRLQCKECRMTVHRNCYGVVDNRHLIKWVCDMCSNDKNPQNSWSYKCVLCPIEHTEHDFVEPPRISHKKKTEKEREREKLEKEMAVKAAAFYRKRQADLGRPVDPREPLKSTADNNWVHVTCAVFTPEVKFGRARALEPCEGIPSIPRARFQEVCKVCKKQEGACVSCQQCRAPLHVECAYQAGHILGFDITPVKGSRRDQHSIVSIGNESGTMTAGIWCKEHPPKTPIHRMQDLVDESGMNALQLYVRNFKQADQTLVGCARKANFMTAAVKPSSVAMVTSPVNRRASTTTLPQVAPPPSLVNGYQDENAPEILRPCGKICLTCGTDVSPKWYHIDENQEQLLVNGYHGTLGMEAQKFVAQRNYQCHKCKKANRQPRAVVVKEENSPPPPPIAEVSRSSAQAVQAVQASSSSPQGPMSVRHIAPQPWDEAPRAASLEAPAAQPAPPPIAAPSLGPPQGPPPGLSPVPVAAPMAASVAPQVAPPIATPIAPPISTPIAPPAMAQTAQPPHIGQPVVPPVLPPSLPPRASPGQYAPPPPVASYNDWRRPSSQHGSHAPPPPPALHHMNGGHPQMPSSMPSLAPPNHLRPPSLSNLPPPPPPLQNGHSHGHSHGHHGPPSMVNGMPPSPRGLGPPPSLPNGGPYMPPYHQGHPPAHPISHPPGPPPHGSPHAQGPSPYHLTNGGPPPRPVEHPYAQVMHPQRSPFTTPHGSPPMARESVMGSREPLNPPPRPLENRQPSGASASPSLRNLLH